MGSTVTAEILRTRFAWLRMTGFGILRFIITAHKTASFVILTEGKNLRRRVYIGSLVTAEILRKLRMTYSFDLRFGHYYA